jgi:hypothetical protein
MHSQTDNLLEISSDQLAAVIGGATTAPRPIVPMPNMGAPKYSAAWWDIVRSRGLDR